MKLEMPLAQTSNHCIPLSELEHLKLDAFAHEVRKHVIRMATKGGCFLGASLSCVDLLVYLYNHFLKIDTQNLHDPNRDYLFLSKGHDVPALYGVFAELELISAERLQNHLSTNDDIYWHPNRNIPGVEFHSGSLGHLLSVAIGVALDCRMKNQKNKIVVILGDGELNEGSVWEALLVASAFKLDNLIPIIDRNFFQANRRTEELIPLDSIEQKLESFGWQAATVDGHNFNDLHTALNTSLIKNGRPYALIAETRRGKGLPSIEERADRWFCNFSAGEIAELLQELSGRHRANLHSETLIVR